MREAVMTLEAVMMLEAVMTLVAGCWLLVAGHWSLEAY